MDRVLNWPLISNPANWIIVILVLYVVALIVQTLAKSAQGGSPINLPGL